MPSSQVGQTAFGIGCFHFGVRKLSRFKFIGSEYVNELKNALNSIPNINEVNISADDTFCQYSKDIRENLPKLDEGNGFFPHPSYSEIAFNIFIPTRIQVELAGGRESRIFSENFSVLILYGYSSPIAVVEVLSPSDMPDPSSAVVVVRKFLEREFEKPISDYISFECIGPSPLHADFFLVSKEEDTNTNSTSPFYAECDLAQAGYDTITFYYNSAAFKNPHDALKAIIHNKRSEIDFFYRIKQIRLKEMLDWKEIEKKVEHLIQLENMTRPKGWIKRLFGRSNIIGRTLIDIAIFQSTELGRNNYIRSHYDTLFERAKDKCFKHLIDRDNEPNYYYPTKEYAELIGFFEQRRVKATEIFIVLVSAIVGGSIGTVVTILLSR